MVTGKNRVTYGIFGDPVKISDLGRKFGVEEKFWTWPLRRRKERGGDKGSQTDKNSVSQK